METILFTTTSSITEQCHHKLPTTNKINDPYWGKIHGTIHVFPGEDYTNERTGKEVQELTSTRVKFWG